MALKGLFGDLFPKPDTSIDDTEREGYEVPENEVSKTGNKMILVEPRAYSESTQIADHLKKRNTMSIEDALKFKKLQKTKPTAKAVGYFFIQLFLVYFI